MPDVIHSLGTKNGVCSLKRPFIFVNYQCGTNHDPSLSHRRCIACNDRLVAVHQATTQDARKPGCRTDDQPH